MNANEYIQHHQLHTVRDQVRQAESETSAEIVCAVATESGRYDRAEAIAGLAVAMIALGLLHAAVAGLPGEPAGSWASRGGAGVVWQCLVVGAGFLLGNLLASTLPRLRRIFTRAMEMQSETLRAAGHVFASRGLHRTREASGLLIYISLYEHQVVVLGDHLILEKLGQSFLDEIRDLAIAELKAGNPRESFSKSIQFAVERLKTALPPRPGDHNELPNELLVFHPRP